MTEREVKAPILIEDGMHIGKIIGVEFRTEPYEYCDLLIEEAESGLHLKAGYPDFVSPTSKLGKLITRFTGKELTPGEKLDIEKIFVGKECKFQTIMKDDKKGKFCNIIVDSVKPSVTEEKVGAVSKNSPGSK